MNLEALFIHTLMFISPHIMVFEVAKLKNIFESTNISFFFISNYEVSFKP